MTATAKNSTKNHPKSEVMMVTPEMANFWLQRNVKNRKLSKRTVNRYAKDIANGMWEVNGEAIKIATDDSLLDGQHRLEAVRQAGKSVEMLVISNLPPEVFHTLDTGKMRSSTDVFGLNGETHTTALSSALRLLYVYERTEGDFSKMGPILKLGISTPELEQLLDNHPDIRQACADTWRVSQMKILPHSVAAFLYYTLSKINKREAHDFFERLRDGNNLSREDSLLTLRNTLVWMRENLRGSNNQVKFLAMVIMTWNAQKKGQKLKNIRWEKEDPFPAIMK